MADKNDSLAKLWEFQREISVIVTETRKDVTHLQEGMTEHRLQWSVDKDLILRQMERDKDALLSQMDLITQSLMNEQKARERREQEEERERIRKETLKSFVKYGGAFWIACFVAALGYGVDSEAAAELFARLLSALLS